MNGSGGKCGMHGRAIHWGGDAIERGAEALYPFLRAGADSYVATRIVLEAAIRGADNLVQLLSEQKPAPAQPSKGRPKREAVQVEATT
jgi:hypothetical protein